jgi:uncharacterized protein
MNRILLIAVLGLFVASCGSNGDGEVSASRRRPSPSPTFAMATVLLEGDGGSTLLQVEVAETDEQRALGLMQRESLPEDHGMVFVFFETHRGSFWMKNTLIPLSIAFFDVDGKIRKILDMEPCKADPCPSYDPGVSYMGALEVNQGSFDTWGIEEGDFVRLTR